MNFSLQDKPCSNRMADSRFPTAVISHFYSAVYIIILELELLAVDPDIILSIMLVVSTVVLAVVGAISLRYNKKIISEMEIERKYNLQPFVVCDIISKPGKDFSVAYIVIHNQGRGAAKDIQIELKSKMTVLKNATMLYHQIHLLGANAKTEINIGPPTLSQNTAQINAKLDYSDIFGKTIHDESIIKLSSIFGY